MGFGKSHHVASLGEVLRDQVGVELGDPRMAVTEDATEQEQIGLRLKEVRGVRMPRLVRPSLESCELHETRPRVVRELVETLALRASEVVRAARENPR